MGLPSHVHQTYLPQLSRSPTWVPKPPHRVDSGGDQIWPESIPFMPRSMHEISSVGCLTISASAYLSVDSSPFPYQSQHRIPKSSLFTVRKTLTNDSQIILQSGNPMIYGATTPHHCEPSLATLLTLGCGCMKYGTTHFWTVAGRTCDQTPMPPEWHPVPQISSTRAPILIGHLPSLCRPPEPVLPVTEPHAAD